MHFEAEHHFAAGVDVVMREMVDEALYLDLALPDLSQPEILDRRVEGPTTSLRLRYTFIGRLDPVAQKIIGTGPLRWVQLLEVDAAGRSGRLGFVAEGRADRLHADAAISFTDSGAGTLRRISGELVVSVPFVGALAEHHIVSGLLGRLDLEAAAVTSRLAVSRSSGHEDDPFDPPSLTR